MPRINADEHGSGDAKPEIGNLKLVAWIIARLANREHPNKRVQQAAAAQRVFVGRLHDKTAAVTLFDANSRPRLRLLVGPAGDPRLEFLDAQGRVMRTFTAATP